MNRKQPTKTEIIDESDNTVYEKHVVLHSGALYCKNCKSEGRGSATGYRLFMFYPMNKGTRITANYNTYCTLKCYKEKEYAATKKDKKNPNKQHTPRNH